MNDQSIDPDQTAVAPATTTVDDASLESPDTLVASDLIEEVSIDGMCGVY